MAQRIICIGHQKRKDRGNLGTRSNENPDEHYRALTKKGPLSVETRLKELEDNYKSKPEWKVIEGGGVLSIPVEEEPRMENSPHSECQTGQVVFKAKRGGGGEIVGQTIDNMTALTRYKYEADKKVKVAGKSEAKKKAEATKIPPFMAMTILPRCCRNWAG